MTTIREEDFIQSVADAFQFISYYHPVDYIRPLVEAYEREHPDTFAGMYVFWVQRPEER